MLGLSVQIPPVPPTPEDAVARALAAAGTVSGGYAGPPCAFVQLRPDVAARVRGLRPEGAGAGPGVLVTVCGSGETDHWVHLRERSLTAAQRFMLALACDGVESQWVADVPDAQAFRDAGVDLAGRVPVGLVWCHPG